MIEDTDGLSGPYRRDLTNYAQNQTGDVSFGGKRLDQEGPGQFGMGFSQLESLLDEFEGKPSGEESEGMFHEELTAAGAVPPASFVPEAAVSEVTAKRLAKMKKLVLELRERLKESKREINQLNQENAKLSAEMETLLDPKGTEDKDDLKV